MFPFKENKTKLNGLERMTKLITVGVCLENQARICLIGPDSKNK